MLTALLPLLLTWLFLRRLVPLLRRRMLDQPNGRSSHRIPTPRGGGVAFVLVGGITAVCLGGWIPLLCLPLAFVGLLDDRLDLPAGLRYGVQLATGLALLITSPFALLAGSSLPRLLIVPMAVILVISATAVINFTNFMDGLDGLLAGCLIVVFVAAASAGTTGAPYWALAGSLLGFLAWNWSPAKVFMGDVGSTFLGAVFAGLVLHSPTWGEAFGLLLVATPLMADACVCVLRRLFAGDPVFAAHRLHLFQRLHQAGWPHERVASLYIATTAALALARELGGLAGVIGLASLVMLAGLWLDQRVAVPFADASSGSSRLGAGAARRSLVPVLPE